MKAYFEKVYANKESIYCMNTHEPFIDSKGNLVPKHYTIYGSMILSDGELTDWEVLKSYTNKKIAIKYFESLIKKEVKDC